MYRVREKIETTANIAIIIVALLLSITLVKNYLFRPSPSDGSRGGVAQGQSGMGNKVNIARVDWARNGQTLLLILSSSCQYCTESAPFYRRLTKEVTSHTIAVMPQSILDGQAYLDGLGVTVNEVRQESLTTLGAVGTPTLTLVNDSGVVVGSWVGKLSPEQEDEVLRWAQINRASR